ncbi:S-adenosyl-L-methionine-dependent methyltransferase [Hesseltinella vesiculosa]|uniref:S-adenosyl-L-methionine-dependent methyltransferase n=1 Tax=Hesseltinella vesiculosa TaxID=101127 RepID=A0A1X2GCX3_9FUNG|nr:S-adenosyl-L-methionine-dependent methyltransferase [Hesseltinella vesiculosa]
MGNLPDWTPPPASQDQDQFHRQYPLPALRTSQGRVKLRKQSTPTIRNDQSPLHLAHTSRRPLARVFPFRAFRGGSGASTPDQLSPSPSLLAVSDVSSPDAIHPLLQNMTKSPSSTLGSSAGQLHRQISSTSSTQQPPFPSTHHQASSPAHSISPPTPSPSAHTPSSSHLNLAEDPHMNHDCLVDHPSLDVVWHSGRKFFADHVSSYILPCDEEEIDRLHLLHFMVRFAIQGNYLAPVNDQLRKGASVLDIGCGPGSWTMEIAGEYPKSTIIGVDLATMFPRDIKPINCQFHQCDVLRGLPFQDTTFDYVFMRFMGQGIETSQRTELLLEIMRVLKPGGWMEIVDHDLELHRAGPMTKKFNQQLIDLMESRSLDPHAGCHIKDELESIKSLHNIHSSFISCPGGKWAGKLGQLTLQSWKSYYRAIQPILCMNDGISLDEYNEKLDVCWEETDEYKTFENIHFAYAQKKQSS